MNENYNEVKPIRMSDGRYAEKRVNHNVEKTQCGEGYEAEVVTEVWEEDRPLHLTERVTEVKKPCVVERIVETIEGDEVVEKVVEKLDNGRPSMRTVDWIAAASRQEEEEPPLTREELLTAIREINSPCHCEDVRPMRRMQPVIEDAEPKKKVEVIDMVLLGIIALESVYLFVTAILPALGG